MKDYNVTAQVYETADQYKQTILLNKQIEAESSQSAIDKFIHYFLVPHYQLVKIYSVEEISQAIT